MNTAAKLLATFGYTGFFPFAPATFATAVFCAIYWFVPGGEWLVHPLVCAVTLIVSIPVSTRMEALYGKDPGCVVIDEIVGIQIVLIMATGVSAAGLLVAFVLFRIFDIAKPYPIARTQALPGGWGIVIDDILAAIYARVLLGVIALKFPGLGGYFF